MPIPGNNLAVRLLDTAHQRGWSDRVALRQGEHAWTYADLTVRVRQVAAMLRGLGIERGQRVALFMSDSLETAAAILGILHAGTVAVPLSEQCRPADVRAYIDHCGATAIIVDVQHAALVDAVRDEIATLTAAVCVGAPVPAGMSDYHQLCAETHAVAEAAAVGSDDAALILYSIADVERDLRGVTHSHGTPVAAFVSFAENVLGLDADDRVLATTRLCTVYGLGLGLFFPLAAGAQSWLIPERAHSESVFAAIASFAPSVFLATPSMYRQLVRAAESQDRPPPLTNCRVCLSTAEGMPPPLLSEIRDTLGVDVTVGYGLAEVFQLVLIGSVEVARRGACGRPVSGFGIRIVDDHGQPVGPGVIGTLQIRGPALLTGYWDNTRDRHRPRLVGDANEPNNGWFTTRDRFMMDEYGNYYYFGRIDDLFNVGGQWVSPAELERVLVACEAVWECAVIGAEDEDGLSKPLAFVVPNIGHAPTPELVRYLTEYLQAELPPHKYPQWIEFIDALPRGPGGKVLRYKLHAKAAPSADSAPTRHKISP